MPLRRGSLAPHLARGRRMPHVSLLAFFVQIVSPACEPAVHERSGFVMGTVSELKIVSSKESEAERALDRANSELERIEAIATVHSDSSEISRLCRAAERGFQVGADLDHILKVARLVTGRSGGAFDPSVGAIVRLWGFPKTPSLPDSQAIEAALATVGPHRWSLSEEPPELFHPSPDATARDRIRRWLESGPGAWTVREGTFLDLGGIAKGYAVDRATDLLSEVAGSCLVNAGGDLAIRGTRADGNAWLIGIQDPRDPSKLFTRVRLQGRGAIATSGDYERFFEEGGVRYHHIFDPRSGWPTRGIRSVSIIAPSCELADAWATATFVLGPDEGLVLLETEPEMEGLILIEDENGDLVRRETSGFAAFEEKDSHGT